MKTTGNRRWWVLGTIVLAVLAITLDVTVLSVALPTLSHSLHATESQLQWFVTAYTLALVAGMLPVGLLGDRFGRKRVMVVALLTFALGSFGCAYSGGVALFVASRVLLGFSGSAVVVVALSTITVLFDERERPRAVGIWGGANFLGLPLGPIFGGLILNHAWWGWIFLMNVPVALFALVAVLLLMPESRSNEAGGIDGLGLLLSSAALVALMYGVIQAGSKGWSSASAFGAAAAGIAIFVPFALWERRVTDRGTHRPLVDLALFRSKAFAWGMILASAGGIGLFGVLFSLPQYFQGVTGLDPEGSGIHLLPLVAGLLIGAVSAERLTARIGSKLAAAGGFLVIVVGSVVGSTMSAASGAWFVAAWTFLVGLGGGFAFATAASAALVELSAEQSGVGSALLQAVIKLGPAFGASILGSVLNGTYQGGAAMAALSPAVASVAKTSVFAGVAVAEKLGSGALLASVRSAFVAGMDRSLLVAAAIGLAALLLSLLFLPARPLPNGSRPAAGDRQVTPGSLGCSRGYDPRIDGEQRQ